MLQIYWKSDWVVLSTTWHFEYTILLPMVSWFHDSSHSRLESEGESVSHSVVYDSQDPMDSSPKAPLSAEFSCKNTGGTAIPFSRDPSYSHLDKHGRSYSTKSHV